MSNIDEQFVDYVVKSLVNKPDAVKVDRRIDEKGVLLELTVDPEDLGRVIGKRGATAQSIRTLLRALGTKNDARYNLKIVDNGTYEGGSRNRDESRDTTSNDNPVKSEDTAITSDDSAAPAVADVVQDEPPVVEESPPEEAPPAEEEVKQPETSDRLSQTRKELEELDDLDV